MRDLDNIPEKARHFESAWQITSCFRYAEKLSYQRQATRLSADFIRTLNG